ncbi:MAG TPA: 16S rRNA (uracil(1498)-N(3))-methyltransferase [Nitrospira sp.]|nr:16S rRNA (uracil(1498)-N(3))-methyltransferase [Nitrospira sp.]
MPTFFVASEAIAAPTVRITGPLLRHLRESLRLQLGETISITDDRGHRYRTEIAEVTGRELVGRILETTSAPPQAVPSLVLAQALIKGEKMEWVIQKATELGVARIRPVQATHSVVRPRPNRIEHQRTRWQRIALEAAQQSERWSVPVIDEPVTISELLTRSKPAASKIVLAERSDGTSLMTVPLPRAGDEVWLLIGPEGGWNSEELEQVLRDGYTAVTLGPRILRAETAAIATISVLQSRLGGLG